MHSLAHVRHSDSRKARGDARRHDRRQSAALVLNLGPNRSVFANHENARRPAAGVAMKIGERLLHNAKNRRFDLLVVPPQILWNFDLRLDSAALGEAPCKPVERWPE